MMKKLLLLLILSISLFSTATIITKAQGTFTCRMSGYGGPQKCIVITTNCDTDHIADTAVCSGITDSNVCRNSSPFPCIKIAPIPGTGGVLCGGNSESINTAIGCIPVGNLSAFTGFLLSWAVGIGGGIAFLLIIISGFMIMTASGNPERLQAAKELMTSALMGLIMLIFSVFILKLIGVDILHLPGIQ